MTESTKRNILWFVGITLVFGAVFATYQHIASKSIANAAWPTLDGGVYTSPVTRGFVTSLVPDDQLYDGGSGDDGIPALTNPKYASVLASDAVIADSLMGIDVLLDGEHRFYPVQIMNWHEVVNDSWGGKDLAVTYCALCGTGVVYDRNVDGKTLSFVSSGKIYNDNTVLKDNETGSLWVQALGQAVQGDMIGKTLTTIPSHMMTWSDWKAAYPDGLVLSTDTGIARDYTRHPYGGYDTSKGFYFPFNHMDSNFSPKWVVYGVTDGTNGLAFSDTILVGTGLNTAKLGDQSVIAVYDFVAHTVRVFQAGSHTFSYDFAKHRLTDNETGSVWNAAGVAVSGSLTGESLNQYQVLRGFWGCISALHPTWAAVTTPSPETQEQQNEQ